MTSRRKIFSLFSLRSPWSSSSPHLSLAVVLKKKIAPQLCSLSIPGCAGSRTISDVVLFLSLVLCSELCELWRDRKSSFRAKTRYRREHPLTPSSRPASPQTLPSLRPPSIPKFATSSLSTTHSPHVVGQHNVLTAPPRVRGCRDTDVSISLRSSLPQTAVSPLC